MKALEGAKIDPASVEAELRLTEFGERMKLSLRLPDNYLFDPEVNARELRSWVESKLRAQWGFKAASRTWHIARSGCDVDVPGPYRNHSPTTVPVEWIMPVPGSPEESTNLFDVSQILAWLAKERRDIQQQMEWREQIPALMASLAAG